MSSSSSQIFLLGATGRTGRLVLAEALSRNYHVTAMVRKASHNLPEHANLTIVVGDPTSTNDVKNALGQCIPDTPVFLISTLGQTRTSGNPFAATTSPPRYMEASIRAVISATEEMGKESPSFSVRKLVVMSMFGVGDSFANLNCIMRGIMKWSNMAQTLEDQDLVNEVVKAAQLPFVLVRPAMLKEGSVAPLKFYESSGKGAGFMPSVTVHSVARFLVDVVATNEYDGTAPVITN
ncbi:hypothetical protein ABEF95_008341 [Exophiala dermatitidis]